MLRNRYDAVILGGGPGGATAALMLSEAGWRVALVEKREFPRRKLCGDFVSGTTLALLQELRLDERWRDLSGPNVRRVGLFDRAQVLTAPMPKAAGWGRAIGREHLDYQLLSAAARAGACLFHPWKACRYAKDSGEWVCRIERGSDAQELAAPVLLVATGSLEHGGLATDRGTASRSDLLAFKAYFRDCDLPGDLMPLLAFEGGYGGLVRAHDGLVSLSCCIRRDVLVRCRAPRQRAAEAVLQHISASCDGVRAALGRSTRDGLWLAAGPIRPGIRHAFRNGVFFVGNAAGEAHPIIAEGISMAVQSAWLLCRRLIAGAKHVPVGRLVEDAGREYRADWTAAFALRIHAAALFAAIFMRPPATALARPVLTTYPLLLTFGAYLAGKSRACQDIDQAYGRLLPLV